MGPGDAAEPRSQAERHREEQVWRTIMIRNESEYQEASTRLAEERARLTEHRARLKEAGLKRSEGRRDQA